MHRSATLLAVCWLAGLGACVAGPEPAEPPEVFREGSDFVRLVTSYLGKTDHSHPARITPQQMKTILSGFHFRQGKGEGSYRFERWRVFSDSEVQRIHAKLALALSQARPDQEVSFRLVTLKGHWSYMSPHLTSGLVFVRGQSLQFAFGNVNVPPRSDFETTYEGDPRLRYSFDTWRLEPVGEQFLVRPDRYQHYNWIAVPLPLRS